MRRYLLAALWLPACSPELTTPSGTQIACKNSGECPLGFECREAIGRCVPLGAAGNLPDVVAHSVMLSPDLGSTNTTFTLGFEVTEPLARPPVVRLSAAGGPQWQLEAQQDRHYTYSYNPTGTEGEGVWQVLLDIVSVDGVEARAIGIGSIQLDFTPPSVLSPSRLLTPAPGSLLSMPQALTNGSRVSAWLPTSEPVLIEDELKLLVDCNDSVVALSLLMAASTPSLLAFGAEWECVAHEVESCTARITLEDHAGNRSVDLPVDDLNFTVDCKPPDASELDLSWVKHLRLPWGAAELGAEVSGQWLVRSDYQPGDDLLAPIESSAFSVPGEDIALVAVYGVSGGLLGTLQPSAAGFVPTQLTLADAQSVLVAVVDSAGNLSEKRTIEHSEWVATFGRKVAGSNVENPHRLVQQRFFAGSLLLEGIEASAEVGAVDGATASTVGAGSWARLDAPLAPSFPYGSGMVADTARGVVVLFGGFDGAEMSNALWELNGFRWQRIAPTDAHGDGSPGARAEFAMAYDSRRQVTLLFGGCTKRVGPGGNEECEGMDDQHWEWNGTSWRRRCANAAGGNPCGLSPPPRYRASASYDAHRGMVVLYGGCSAFGCASVDDTLWGFDGEQWTVLASNAPPGARYSAGLAYDIERARLVLFGGGEGGPPSSGTWEWNGETFTAASAGTPGLYHPALTYDLKHGRVVRFGGAASPHDCGDIQHAVSTLEWWNGVQWQQLPLAGDTFLPESSPCPTMAPVLSGGELLLAPGDRLGIAGPMESYVLHNGTLRALDQHRIPPTRYGAQIAYAPLYGKSVMFGGQSIFGGAPMADTLVYDDRGWPAACDPLYDDCPAEPTARVGAAACANNEGRVVLFGGASGAAFGDTYEWQGEGAGWSMLCASCGPTARHGASLVSAGIPTLFGGFRGDGEALFDTQVLSGSGSEQFWVQRCTRSCTPPPQRGLHGAAYDPIEEVMVLFGGRDHGLVHPTRNDTWLWDGTRWEPWHECCDAECDMSCHEVDQPEGRFAHATAFDPARREIVLTGGLRSYVDSIGFGDTWSFYQQRWQELTVADPEGDGSPFGLSFGTLWHHRDRLLYYGVSRAGNAEFWEWRGGADAQPAHIARFDVGSQIQLEGAVIEQVHVRWMGGGLGYKLDECDVLVSGAALWLWRLGRWELLDESSASAGGVIDASLQGNEDNLLSQLTVGQPTAIYVAATPIGTNGCAGDRAAVHTDYIELRVTTR